MKKTALAFSALVLAISLFIFLRESQGPREPNPGISPALAKIGEMNSRGERPALLHQDFSAEDQAEIQNCLGVKAGNFSELEKIVLADAGPQKSDQLEWKVVQFEDSSGQLFRARLARELTESGQSHLTLNVFSVDSEGLPDRIHLSPSDSPNPDLSALDHLLRNKRISNEIENRRFFFANEKELVTEKDGGHLLKLQYAGGNIRLACEKTPTAPSCHCVR